MGVLAEGPCFFLKFNVELLIFRDIYGSILVERTGGIMTNEGTCQNVVFATKYLIVPIVNEFFIREFYRIYNLPNFKGHRTL